MRLVPSLSSSFVAAAVCLASATAPLTALAQQTLKPGLWDIKSKVGGNPQMEQAMAQMQKQMAAMPPAQRKQMEDLMAKQGMQIGADGMSARVCISKEQAERGDWMGREQRSGDCKTTRQDRSGSSYKTAWTCATPPSSGEAEVTISGSEAYRSKVVLTRTLSGKPETTTVDGSGKWASADCGAIKPFAPPVAAK